uniref:Magnetosome protein MamI-2 n=1 Tax=Candidatus Magnetananas rongchengensis TaxID=1463558 RepID=A0A3S6J0V8_9BACT|nr:magnetosome protein MamI-2 [Candidatus Magnetananas rongchenensis]
MNENQYSDNTIWILVAIVFIGVLIMLITVFNHDKQKPKSPQALVAAGFNQLFNSQNLTIQEWKPGMGPQPLMYHPAAFQKQASQKPVWQQLPSRNTINAAGQNGAIQPNIQWRPINRK